MKKYLTNFVGLGRMNMTTYLMFATPKSDKIKVVIYNHLSLPKGRLFWNQMQLSEERVVRKQ